MNQIPVQYRASLRLEQLLGDPGTAENLLSYHNAVAWDEREQFPEPALAKLHQLHLHQAFVPKSLGGQFESCESFIALGRVLARRNMSVAVSYSTMLWTMLVWIGGNTEQQQRIARAILAKGEFPCLAYTEESHGADLLANETSARLDENGRYRVRGEKWPINRATRSQWVVLLARTNPASHPGNHSLFIFDKARLDSREFCYLPGAKTHGLRGCDISGIAFRDCQLPEDSRIGREGDGLELALKGFQITRTFCTALSLGVGDSGLRIVVDFARNRRLYGRCVSDLPHARDTLANVYLSLLISECATLAAARGLHLFPEQFSTWSSVSKVQVTRLSDYAMQQLAGVLGARSYLRGAQAGGMFQKFLRDGAIVQIFDGSNIVCLDRLASVLPKLCRSRTEEWDEDAIAGLFDLQRPLPPLAFDRLTLRGRGKDVVMQSLPHLVRKLAELSPNRYCDAAILQALRDQSHELQKAVAEIAAEVRSRPAPREERNSASRFGLAERYCALHSAICCLGFWIFNRDCPGGGFTARGEWLAAALARWGDANFHCGRINPEFTEILCQQLFFQTDQSQMYSLLPWPLAQPGQREQGSDSRLFPPN